MNSHRRIAAWAGLALVVLTNAVALGGAAYNRMGAPEGTLKLSERELVAPYDGGRTSENSGLSLRLRWRTLASAPASRNGRLALGGNGVGTAWLDERKMRELGFDIDTPTTVPAQARRSQLPREVFIVLEFDGPAYQESLRRAEAVASQAGSGSTEHEAIEQEARSALQAEQSNETRLFAVDAGVDRSALRAKYADRAKYAIVRGRVRPVDNGDHVFIGGEIDGLGVDEVNVPLRMRPVFDRLERSAPGAGTHFDATVVFGARSEPWLASAARRPAG